MHSFPCDSPPPEFDYYFSCLFVSLFELNYKTFSSIELAKPDFDTMWIESLFSKYLASMRLICSMPSPAPPPTLRPVLLLCAGPSQLIFILSETTKTCSISSSHQRQRPSTFLSLHLSANMDCVLALYQAQSQLLATGRETRSSGCPPSAHRLGLQQPKYCLPQK